MSINAPHLWPCSSESVTLASHNLVLGDLGPVLLVDEHRLQALVVGEAIAEDQAIDGVRAQARDQRAQVGAIGDAGVCKRLDEILHIQALGRAYDGVHNDGGVATRWLQIERERESCGGQAHVVCVSEIERLALQMQHRSGDTIMLARIMIYCNSDALTESTQTMRGSMPM
jgi:hypothetical protein